MKHLIVLALASLASANAFALPKTSKIISMDLDPKAVSGGSRYNTGSITVDAKARTASLYLTFKCPPGRVCPAVMIRPFAVSLEMVSRKTTRCGSVIYTAESDRQMADGLRQFLTVIDNTGNRCPTTQMLAPVEATYETAGRTMQGRLQTRSTFIGDEFISPMY